MNKDMIDALPILLRRLSDGEGLHIPTISAELEIPEKTIQDNIKKYLVTLGDMADIQYDYSTKKWTARRNFLSETLLSADEIITMKLLEISSQKFGKRFELYTHIFLNRFKRRSSLTIFKKTKMEKIEKDDEGKFAIIKTAISKKRVLHCRYNDKARIIHPLKIVLLEGFWYLFFWDTENNEVRKYHLKSIEAIELKDEIFVTPENRVINHLGDAINAYFKDAEFIPVRLFVHKEVSKYFKRQPLSSSQTIKSYNTNYDQMDIWVTDEMEIIPTIQQYLPYIKVDSPDSLHKSIEENIANYSKLDL